MPTAKNQVILVAGGTGFVGKHVVSLLQRKGYQVVIHARSNKAVPTYADIIVNLVGIIREDEQTFQDVHVEFTKWLVGLGKKLKVQQFVQMSALGVERKETNYAKTKFQAEEIVRKSGLPFAIIRPSMIFGPEDKSINTFRKISRTGLFPVMGTGTVQPVSIDTVAAVILAAVERRIRNRVVEIGGPEIFTYKQLADRIHPGVHAFKLPRFIVTLIATIGEWFTALPTPEQVAMLSQSNTTKDKTVERLGIKNPKLK